MLFFSAIRKQRLRYAKVINYIKEQEEILRISINTLKYLTNYTPIRDKIAISCM